MEKKWQINTVKPLRWSNT